MRRPYNWGYTIFQVGLLSSWGPARCKETHHNQIRELKRNCTERPEKIVKNRQKTSKNKKSLVPGVGEVYHKLYARLFRVNDGSSLVAGQGQLDGVTEQRVRHRHRLARRDLRHDQVALPRGVEEPIARDFGVRLVRAGVGISELRSIGSVRRHISPSIASAVDGDRWILRSIRCSADFWRSGTVVQVVR